MRKIVLAALGSLALAAVIVFGLRWLGGQPETTALAEVSIGGPFTLTDQNGRRVSDEEFRGRLMLVGGAMGVCALALVALAEQAGMPKGVFNVITCDSSKAPEVGKVLCASPIVKNTSPIRRNTMATTTPSQPNDSKSDRAI